MGLDNGIMIKIKDKEKLDTKIFQDIGFKGYGSDVYDVYEILYWRKCWNIREVILDHLESNGITTCDDCSFDMYMPLDVLESLISEKLPECYSPTWWNEHDDSVWSFDEICVCYHQDLLSVMRLIERLRDVDPNAYEIFFYDSY